MQEYGMFHQCAGKSSWTVPRCAPLPNIRNRSLCPVRETALKYLHLPADLFRIEEAAARLRVKSLPGIVFHIRKDVPEHIQFAVHDMDEFRHLLRTPFPAQRISPVSVRGAAPAHSADQGVPQFHTVIAVPQSVPEKRYAAVPDGRASRIRQNRR